MNTTIEEKAENKKVDCISDLHVTVNFTLTVQMNETCRSQ